MSAPVEDALWRKLEARGAVLETARARYHEVRPFLRSFWWRRRLRENAELLQLLISDQPTVDRALDAASERSVAENWPVDSEARQRIEELLELRLDLRALIERRLGRDYTAASFAELWAMLEARITGPRAILPNQKWSAALQVIPRSLPELKRLEEDAHVLERAFKKPAPPSGFPLDELELAAVARALPSADNALNAIWKRVHRCDPSGTLLRFLQRRARRAPLREPRNGPEALLAAVFWTDLARARLRAFVDERLPTLRLADELLLPVCQWIFRGAPEATTELPGLPPDRIHLLELAHDLAEQDRRGQPTPAERLLMRARRADQLAPTEEAVQLKGWLRVRARVAQIRAANAADRFDSTFTFEALVRRAWPGSP